MAIWDYQLILFPKGNSAELTQDGMEFVGPYYFDFQKVVNKLEKIQNIKNDKTLKSWKSFSDECYFLYDDGKYRVEIELNSGTKEEKVELISLRTNIYKDEGNIVVVLNICKLLSEELNLSCWNMKLRQLINLNDCKDVEMTKNHFDNFRME